MYYFVAVNYGTSNLIESWVSNIRSFDTEGTIIIVDNFKDDNERQFVKLMQHRLGFSLIELGNVGYGVALNNAISFCLDDSNGQDFVVLAGNLDIVYENIPKSLPSGKYVYISKAMEGKRNRNPFLTRLQRKAMKLHRLVLLSNSVVVLMGIFVITKIIGKIPSKIWTTHGSMFGFHSKCLDKDNEIFNSDSFLYGEELEFGSYMESQKCEFIEADIVYRHEAHAATGSLVDSRKKFMSLWTVSFNNWLERWC